MIFFNGQTFSNLDYISPALGVWLQHLERSFLIKLISAAEADQGHFHGWWGGGVIWNLGDRNGFFWEGGVLNYDMFFYIFNPTPLPAST